jgi:hypothetical protein
MKVIVLVIMMQKISNALVQTIESMTIVVVVYMLD